MNLIPGRFPDKLSLIRFAELKFQCTISELMEYS